jgi:hypothetical protein
MATTTGQRLAGQQQASHRVAALATAVAAAVLAGAAGLAVLVSQTTFGPPAEPDRYVTQVHAAGRGFVAGLGSYATSWLTSRSRATGYASGRGGLMEYASLELPAAAAPAVSRPRGGVLESADVR